MPVKELLNRNNESSSIMSQSGVLVKNGKLKFLDFVRAAATIAVFVFHTGYLFAFSRTSIINWVKLVTDGGTVGVSVFFVLSGFLLFYQLYKNKEQLDGPKLKAYIKKRLLRILPLYYFSLFFIVIFLRHDILFAADGVRSILYNLIFTRGIKSGGGGGTITINPVYWSLVVEMHFYILLPIFYHFFYKLKNILLFVGVLLLGVAYRLALVYLVKTPSMQFMRFTPANFDYFALGMLGAYLYVNHAKVLNYIGNQYLQIASVVVFILFVHYYDLSFLPTLSYVFAPVLLGFITVFCMLSFLMNDRSLLSKIFTSAPFLYIAKISFSIYIWHAIIISKVDVLALPNAQKIIINIVLTLVVSATTYYLVEAPFLRVKNRKIASV